MAITYSKSETLHALRFACWFLLALFTLFLLIGNVGIASSFFPGSKLAAFAGIALSTVILFFTANRWAKWVPGLLFLSVFNSLLMALSGHVLSNPSIKVSRIVPFTLALLYGIGCALTLQFGERRLSWVDRAVLVGYVLCCVWALFSDLHLAFFILATCVVAVHWLYHRKTQRL